jgi:hypothetical protein
MGKHHGFGGPDMALKLKAAFYLEMPKSHFKQNKIDNLLSSRAIPVSRAREVTLIIFSSLSWFE